MYVYTSKTRIRVCLQKKLRKHQHVRLTCYNKVCQKVNSRKGHYVYGDEGGIEWGTWESEAENQYCQHGDDFVPAWRS